MRKFMRGAAIFTVVFILLTACGQKSSPDPVKLDGKPLTVVTTYGPNDGGHDAFVLLCGEFSESTGAKITDNSADSTEIWKQDVIASFDSGNEADVLFFFSGNDTDALIKNNKFVSLDEIRQSYPDYASNINLAVLEGMKAADGKGYAVPVKGYWERLFINTDIFENLGLTPPKTVDDLFALSQPLNEAGVIPIAASLSEVPHYLFEALLFNFTGPSKHHNIPKYPDNIPESWVSALEMFTSMYRAGLFPDDAAVPTHADAFELFQSKKAAMIVDGDWSVAYIRDPQTTEVVNFPAILEQPRISTDLISGFSMGFYITRKAWDDPEKRDAAVAFVQFITSNSSILRLNVSGAAMPISLGTADSEAQNNTTPLRGSIDVLNTQTTAFVGAVADEFLPEARAWLFSQLLPLAHGEADAREVLQEFVVLNNKG